MEFALGRPDGGLDDPHAVAGEYLVERTRELALAVADQEFEVLGAIAEIHEQVAACWAVQAPVGVRGDAQDVHPPGLDFHHEEDVQTSEEHGVSVQEVA